MRRLTSALACLLPIAFGCAHRLADATHVLAGMEANGSLRIDWTIWAERTPPNCEILEAGAVASLDGRPLEIRNRGVITRPSMVSGIEVGGRNCSGAFITGDGINPVADGTPSELRVQSGSHVLELQVMNLRAVSRIELDRSDAAPGEKVSIWVGPDGDPPLSSQDLGGISIYSPEKRVAVLQHQSLESQGRKVTFALPTLPPGKYRVQLHVNNDPPVATCKGAGTCRAVRFPAPADVPLTIR